MGTIRKGILGGFSGKVGTVVGSSWKGITLMRSLPTKVKNAHSMLQLMQRAKFALTILFLKPMNGLLRIGWKLFAFGQSPINAAMSYTITNAITGDYPDYAIDPEKVLISSGSLTPAVNATATPVPGAVNFEWDDNSDWGDAKPTDKALLALVNPARRRVVYITEGAQRSEGTQSVRMPNEWVGENVDAFIGFISEDGKQVANSVYLGSITLA